MNIILSNSSSLPIYEQLKNSIKQAIFSNELKEEEGLIETYKESLGMI